MLIQHLTNSNTASTRIQRPHAYHFLNTLTRTGQTCTECHFLVLFPLLINSMNSLWVRLFFPRPDLVIYFDCPEEIALSRKRDTENIEYLIERRELYKDLSDRCGWIKIDRTLPVKEIAFTIKNIVYEKLRIQSV